ncbi:CD81 antigen [Dendroctonus ponderosae]|uniref:CD81 antigen n=1 Tax=Dendroctonus ponderosae TaxID=77166 RepID=UPI002034C989|nr:CD81 antigen [Dendroctonus ponderosae]KAH1027715.1 hypothetical protein HUJ05_001169 [Dendroctonus ponderosae]
MGCYSCMRLLYVVLNSIFFVIGIVSLGLVTWVLVDQTIPLNFAQEPDDNMIVSIIYLVMTLVLVLLSILGMYGAGKEVKWALAVSFSLLLIVIVVEVTSGVWIWMNRDTLDEFTHLSVKRTVQEIYDNDKQMKEILDTIQSKMHCCGADNPTDWSRNKHINLGINSKPTRYNIPTSCCREDIAPSLCTAVTQEIKMGENLNFDVIFEKGCYVLIKERVLGSLTIIFIVYGSIVGVQILGLLIGLILTFSMNRTNRYKS